MNNRACRNKILGIAFVIALPLSARHQQVSSSCRDHKLIDTEDLRVTSGCMRKDGRDVVTLRVEPSKIDPSQRLRTLLLEFCGQATVETVPVGWKADVGPWAAGSSLALRRDADVPAPERDSTLTVSLSFEGFWRHTCRFNYTMEPKADGGVGAGGVGNCSHDSCLE